MLTLAVSHNIYLTREQRVALVNTEPVEAIGVSVPVWFFLGTTSEPATEVFCKYILTNEPIDYPVATLATGYKINLPQIPEGVKLPVRPLPPVWDELTNAEKDQWLKDHKIIPSPLDLLDPDEGGIASLRFPRHTKVRENGRRLNMVHNVQILDISELDKSLA